jgi:hypothetical protein
MDAKASSAAVLIPLKPIYVTDFVSSIVKLRNFSNFGNVDFIIDSSFSISSFLFLRYSKICEGGAAVKYLILLMMDSLRSPFTLRLSKISYILPEFIPDLFRI